MFCYLVGPNTFDNLLEIHVCFFFFLIFFNNICLAQNALICYIFSVSKIVTEKKSTLITAIHPRLPLTIIYLGFKGALPKLIDF